MKKNKNKNKFFLLICYISSCLINILFLFYLYFNIILIIYSLFAYINIYLLSVIY